MPPRVSICLPVFNGERFVGAAIESAIDQTFSDFELIICDDGSTDGTQSIVSEFAVKEPRIKYTVNSERLGLFPNYNRCMQLASGEFTKLFAQDDLYEPTLLETQVSAFEQHPNVVLATVGKNWIDGDGSIFEMTRQFDELRIIEADEVIYDNLANFTNWVGEPSCVMFRRCHSGSGFDTRFYHYGDIEYWFRILRNNGSLCYIPKVLCNFRRHEHSETSYNKRSLNFALDIVRLGLKYRDLLESKGIPYTAYFKDSILAMARVVYSLSDDEDIEGADTSRACDLDEATVRENFTLMTQICFEAFVQMVKDRERANALLREVEADLHKTEEELSSVLSSVSWQVTEPVRAFKKLLKP